MSGLERKGRCEIYFRRVRLGLDIFFRSGNCCIVHLGCGFRIWIFRKQMSAEVVSKVCLWSVWRSSRCGAPLCHVSSLWPHFGETVSHQSEWKVSRVFLCLYSFGCAPQSPPPLPSLQTSQLLLFQQTIHSSSCALLTSNSRQVCQMRRQSRSSLLQRLRRSILIELYTLASDWSHTKDWKRIVSQSL